MNLRIAFRNARGSAALVAQVEQRARRLAEEHGGDCRLHVVFARDAGRADVEIVGKIARRSVVARAQDVDLEEAMDKAFDKLSPQVTREARRRAHKQQRSHGRDMHAAL